jgi:succinoglycan biosynthesis transport protein ExoP
MNNQIPAPPSSGIDLGDIYYILFRHKWKIILCALIGFGAAAGVYFTQKNPFQSEAKLYIQYVISEGKTIAQNAGDNAKSPDQRGETIMSTEREIIQSSDLAGLVVDAIGAERILAAVGGGNSRNAGVSYLRQNLTVRVPPGSSIIHLTLFHPDPELVQVILREIVDRYQKTHIEIHRAPGMLGGQLTQETDRMRTRLLEIEDELRKAKSRAGVLSLDDAKASYTQQISSLRQQIYGVQAELATRNAMLEAMSKFADNTTTTAPEQTAEPAIPQEVVDDYINLSTRITFLRNREQEFRTQFTPESSRVQQVRDQLAEAEASRKKILEEHPRLTRTDVANTRTSPLDQFDTQAAAAQIAALQSKMAVLNSQLTEVRAEIGKVDQLEGAISELNRQKEIQDANYRRFSASLEQNRINETLGAGRIQNISQIQTPSAPFTDSSKTRKLVQMIALAGLGLGLAWSAAIEFFFDRTVRRAGDVERILPYPLLLTIPLLKKKQLVSATRPALTSGQSEALVPAGHGELDTFHETLRDRLIAYFESKNLTHKPKLVALSSMGKSSGVTTTAAGLARTLSDTGEGNVLLVDMTGGQGSAQHFVKGKPACGLDEILDARDNAHVLDNLYVVGASENSDRLYRNLPQRFTKLVPKLKASDFDYIIFDMPPVSEISITPRLAGFMDMVLLVIESEKTDREVVKRGAALLADSRAHVGVVLNKLKSYVPSRLQQEMMNS